MALLRDLQGLDHWSKRYDVVSAFAIMGLGYNRVQSFRIDWNLCIGTRWTYCPLCEPAPNCTFARWYVAKKVAKQAWLPSSSASMTMTNRSELAPSQIAVRNLLRKLNRQVRRPCECRGFNINFYTAVCEERYKFVQTYGFCQKIKGFPMILKLHISNKVNNGFFLIIYLYPSFIILWK